MRIKDQHFPRRPMPYVCSCCRKDVGKVQVCSGCKLVAYCSKECQRKAWPVHKIACKSLPQPSSGMMSPKQQAKAVKHCAKTTPGESALPYCPEIRRPAPKGERAVELTAQLRALLLSLQPLEDLVTASPVTDGTPHGF